MFSKLWGFGRESAGPGNPLDRGCLLFGGLACSLPGDGSIVGNVTNIEILSTLCAQRRVGRPIGCSQFKNLRQLTLTMQFWGSLGASILNAFIP